MTLHYDTQHNDSFVMLSVIYAECHILFIVMLNAIMMSVDLLNVMGAIKRYKFNRIKSIFG